MKVKPSPRYGYAISTDRFLFNGVGAESGNYLDGVDSHPSDTRRGKDRILGEIAMRSYFLVPPGFGGTVINDGDQKFHGGDEAWIATKTKEEISICLPLQTADGRSDTGPSVDEAYGFMDGSCLLDGIRQGGGRTRSQFEERLRGYEMNAARRLLSLLNNAGVITDGSHGVVLRVRHQVPSDLVEITRLANNEFGPRSSFYVPMLVSGVKELDDYIDDALGTMEDMMFNAAVYIGFDMRRERCRASFDAVREGRATLQDHNVLCLTVCPVGMSRDNDIKEILLGMAEVSIQPPLRTSGPFVLPLALKRIVARFDVLLRGRSGICSAYLSNVLLRPDARGMGLSPLLVAACEGRAAGMGYDQLRLHVSAFGMAGVVARGLYKGMGFKNSKEKDENNIIPEWADVAAAVGEDTTGLIMVDGLALRYMEKSLSWVKDGIRTRERF